MQVSVIRRQFEKIASSLENPCLFVLQKSRGSGTQLFLHTQGGSDLTVQMLKNFHPYQNEDFSTLEQREELLSRIKIMYGGSYIPRASESFDEEVVVCDDQDISPRHVHRYGILPLARGAELTTRPVTFAGPGIHCEIVREGIEDSSIIATKTTFELASLKRVAVIFFLKM